MYSIIKQRFLDYINSISYNQEQEDILNVLKLMHTNRVDELSGILVKSIYQNDSKFDEYISLAKIIGVLHDIGRWDQMKTHSEFSDNLAKSDHGEIGSNILLQNDMLNGLENKYQQIIITAVSEHNKKYIGSYDDFTQTFLNVIRDADRIDNLFIEVENYGNKDKSMISVLPYSDEHQLSQQIYDKVIKGSLANVKDLKTKIDFKFFKMVWVFDIKIEKSIEIIRENKYIDDIYADIAFPDETMQMAYEKIQQYLKSI